MTDKKESWARLAEYLSKTTGELPYFMSIPSGVLVPDLEGSNGKRYGLSLVRNYGRNYIVIDSDEWAFDIPAEDLRAFAEWLLKAAG